MAYGTFGFWLLDRREFGINFTIWRSVRETLSLYFNFGTTDLDPRTRYADWFLDSVSVVGVISIAGADDFGAAAGGLAAAHAAP